LLVSAACRAVAQAAAFAGLEQSLCLKAASCCSLEALLVSIGMVMKHGAQLGLAVVKAHQTMVIAKATAFNTSST